MNKPAHDKGQRLRLNEEITVLGPASVGDVTYQPGTEGEVVDHIVLDDTLDAEGTVIYYLLLDDYETVVEAPEFCVEPAT